MRKAAARECPRLARSGAARHAHDRRDQRRVGASPDDPHLALARALKIANLNVHDEAVDPRHPGDRRATGRSTTAATAGPSAPTCTSARKQYGMKFRLSWHWNAGGRRSVLRAGLPRRRLRLVRHQRPARADPDAPLRARHPRGHRRLPLHAHPRAPAQGEAEPPGRRRGEADCSTTKLAAFNLGDRDHDAKWPTAEYREYRRKLAEAIEAMRRVNHPLR